MFKRAYTIKLPLLIFSLFIYSSIIAHADSLTLTTYYPSPTGNYDTLTANTFTTKTTNLQNTTSGADLLTLTGQPSTGGLAAGWKFKTVSSSDNNLTLYSMQDNFRIYTDTDNSGPTTAGFSVYHNGVISFATAGNNVGIGIVNPKAALQVHNGGSGTLYVHGNIDSTFGASTSGSTLWGTTTSDPNGLAIGWNRDSGWRNTNFINIAPGFTPGGFTFDTWDGTTYTNRMRIAPNGNVGIGLGFSTVNSLTVRGSGTGVAQLGVGCGSNYAALTLGQTTTPVACTQYNILSSPSDQNLYINRPTGQTMNFRMNNADQMVLDTNGNMGIGLTNPTAKLNIAGLGGSNVDLAVDGRISTGQVGSNSGGVWVNAARTKFFGDAAGTTMGMYNNGIWGLIMDNTGNVGIGVSATVSDRLVVNGHFTVNEGWSPVQSLSINSNQIWKSNAAPGDSTLFLQYSVNNGAVTIGGNTGFSNNLNVYGNIWGSNTITAQSDARLKQNIVPLKNTLSNLDQLRGVSFEWNKTSTSMGHKEGEKSIGMIAQEVQKVYPELVVSNKKDDKEYLSVDYGKFSSVLLQSIKELKAEVDALKAKVAELEKHKG